MTAPYMVDRSNADYINGKASEPPGTALWITLLLVGVPSITAALGLVFGTMAFYDAKTWLALEEHGLIVTAHYTKLPRSQFGQTGNASGARYRFTIDAGTYTGSGSIPYAVLAGIHPGDPVEVRYLADDPEISTPVEQPFPKGFLTVALFLAAFAAVTGLAAFKFLSGARGDRKRWRAARIVPGEVVSVDIAVREDGNTSQPPAGQTPAASASVLTYVFTSPQSGETISGTREIPATNPGESLPTLGQAVAIRFLDDENHYPL